MNDNRDLHDERISWLYKMGDGTEPPVRIDAVIKQAARDSVSGKKRSYTWPSLATAAVLVLSISLVLKVLNQQPLEDAVMEPMPADEYATSPGVILQERKEMDLAPVQTLEKRKKMDQEAPTPQRYRALKQKAAPAPPQPRSEGAAQLDAIPEAPVGESAPSNARQIDCGHIQLPDTDSREEWIKQYRRAVEQGLPEIARCLQRAYRIRFNQEIPELTR